MRELAPADCTTYTYQPGVRVPASQMDWAWTKPQEMDLKGAAEEEDRKKSHPKLPPPFSLLCNLLIRFEWEPGALRLRKGGGASLSGRMRGDATPPLSIAQSRGPSLPSPSARRGGETRCYKPRLQPPPPMPLSPAPRRLVASPRGHLQAGFPDPPPCLVFPEASPPPCYGGVCAQGSGTRDAALRSYFPSGSGVCMGKSLCQLCRRGCDWGEDGQWGAPTPTLPPGSRRYSVITGKDLVFQKLWC